MSSPRVEYYCACHGPPPSASAPSAAYAFHPLAALFFCEECDAVRCDACVLVEVSGYYCPNCLFEVPSASVRAEKNRCARNCFVCPLCANTLAVVPSDPPEDAPPGAPGEPPFFLYCNHCRWDSADAGITFEKPTGLATQLQKYEDGAPEALEFERLKEHFEPFLRAGAAGPPPAPGTPHANPITAAASSALLRDVPGVARYTPRARRERGPARDELPPYRARVDAAAAGAGADDVALLRGLARVEDVAPLAQRWRGSWAAPLRTSELRPVRIPLQTKKTKRCAACKHILIKPEQKAQSVRHKIKLVAANYLPALSAALPPRAGALVAGRTHAFRLSCTNPLYDPIALRIARAPEARPTFGVALPPGPVPVAAFAEAWEYDEDEEPAPHAAPATRAVGVLEKKANVTVIGGEVVLGKAARGDVKFTLLISFTYRSDEPMDEDGTTTSTPARGGGGSKAELKTFSFSAVVDLGPIVPREEA